MVGLARAGERSRQAELEQSGLGDALHAGRVGGEALGVGIVGKAADLDRVLGGAVAGDPDQVQVQRLPSASSRAAMIGVSLTL